MAIIKDRQSTSTGQPFEMSSECGEGLVLESDYAEDRPISLLAERQREFQRAMQDQYVDAEIPAA